MRDERAGGGKGGVRGEGGGRPKRCARQTGTGEFERVCSARCAIDFDMQFVFEEAGKG